jgi:hypothetical protein
MKHLYVNNINNKSNNNSLNIDSKNSNNNDNNIINNNEIFTLENPKSPLSLLNHFTNDNPPPVSYLSNLYHAFNYY